jgi:hypothetical protein
MTTPINSQIRAVVDEALARVHFEPCGDNSCAFGPPGGMTTNGGCRCCGKRDTTQFQDRQDLKRLAAAVRTLATEVAMLRAGRDG